MPRRVRPGPAERPGCRTHTRGCGEKMNSDWKRWRTRRRCADEKMFAVWEPAAALAASAGGQNSAGEAAGVFRIVSAVAEKRFGAVQRTPERQSGRQPMRKSAKQLRPKSCAFEKILFAEKTAWFETRQTAVPAGAAAPGCAPRSGAQGGCRRRHSRRSGLPAADNDLP